VLAWHTSTQVSIGPGESVKHASRVMCDGLASIEKARLTDFVSSLSDGKIQGLNRALKAALDV
jgi:mRNA-degrading endonuclease toxin of MazEF toxin-antitoxin module